MDIKRLLPRAGPEATYSGNDTQCRRQTADGMATCLPAEAITTHRGTFAPMCRQVFGLVDVDLAIRLLALASQPQRASACEGVRFHFTAAGQFRIHTGFPFKPDRCRIWSGTDAHNISGESGSVNTTNCACRDTIDAGGAAACRTGRWR